MALLVTTLASAQPKQIKEIRSFSEWWPKFQSAVKKGDAAVVAAKIQYPMQWENGATRDVKTPDEFLGHFHSYITSEIKRIVAAKRPVKEDNFTYTITWKARGNEYCLYFKDRGHGFALDGLSEGPP
jgi:hypothetical protein